MVHTFTRREAGKGVLRAHAVADARGGAGAGAGECCRGRRMVAVGIVCYYDGHGLREAPRRGGGAFLLVVGGGDWVGLLMLVVRFAVVRDGGGR